MILISKTDYASVSQSEKSGIKIVKIEHPEFQAELSLYGGQVLSWKPVNEQEIFWISEASKYEVGSAIRGGVPLCWPWFGDWKDFGNHGFARQSLWHLDNVEIDNEKVIIELSLKGEKAHEQWPHLFELKQSLVFAKHFSQSLTFTNCSNETVDFCGALHSYFAVNHVEKTRLPDLAMLPFDCKISSNKRVISALTNAVGPFDRIYYGNGKQRIEDVQNSRTIHVTSKGCEHWVVWNPGQETANAMADVHDNGESEFVCVEAANTTWMSLPAGESAEMSQLIEVAKLS